jgi:hypothetical protein
VSNWHFRSRQTVPFAVGDCPGGLLPSGGAPLLDTASLDTASLPALPCVVAARKARIIVADVPSPWRTELIDALSQEEPSVRVSEYGQEVRRALEEVVDPPKIIILGCTLQGIGGLEALYQADRSLTLEHKKRPPWPNRSVSLITEVRSDLELLDLFRRRGVTQFIYRDDPIERTARTILANLRPVPRALVRIDAIVQLCGTSIPGAVYDISRTGAQLVLAGEAPSETPMVGSELDLELTFRQRRLDCKAVIRRLLTKNGTQGVRLVLGLQFVLIDSLTSDTLDRLISEAAEEFELARDV